MATAAKTRMAAHAAYRARCSGNVQAIISEHKTRKGMRNIDIAKAIGMRYGTYAARKLHPEKMRLEDLWAIFDALDVPEEQRKTVV